MPKRPRSTVATAFLVVAALAAAAPKATAQIAGLPSVAATQGSNFGATRPSQQVTPAHSELTIVPPGFSRLKIAPGFLLQLTVLDDSDYSGDFRVDQQGKIVLPMLGGVQVGGKTVDGARAAIAKKLLDGEILKDPQVNVTVLEYAAPQVTILGEVSSPGRYPLLTATPLRDVLALAGGPTAAAGQEVLISGTESKPVHVPLLGPGHATRITRNVLVHPGDTVQVARAGIVYVLGAVGRPGGYVMADGGHMSVIQAVSMADGTTMSASLGKVYLLRRKPNGGEEQIALPFKKMQRGKAGDVQLQASDILYIPNSKLKSALVNSQGILASATSASIYAVTLY